MAVTPYIYDQFTVIVADVAAKLAIDIKYIWGHPLEVSDQLDQLAKMPTKAAKKYPLIALFTDIPESTGSDGSVTAEVKLHLIIAVNTKPHYTAVERATLNFKPTLYPIFEQLKKSICRSGFYVEGYPDKLVMTKTDRFRYGKTGIMSNTGEIFKDRIDCIEIESLNLTMLKQSCKNGNN